MQLTMQQYVLRKQKTEEREEQSKNKDDSQRRIEFINKRIRYKAL